MSVPNRFAHGDNVRYKVFPLQLKGPEMSAYPSKADLNLISNEDTPSLSHMSVERTMVLYTNTNICVASISLISFHGHVGLFSLWLAVFYIIHNAAPLLADAGVSGN